MSRQLSHLYHARDVRDERGYSQEGPNGERGAPHVDLDDVQQLGQARLEAARCGDAGGGRLTGGGWLVRRVLKQVQTPLGPPHRSRAFTPSQRSGTRSPNLTRASTATLLTDGVRLLLPCQCAVRCAAVSDGTSP